jgi:hypothetical protein
MGRRLVSIAVLCAVSVGLLLLLQEAQYILTRCTTDDASLRASAILTIPAIALYAVATCGLILPLMLGLRAVAGTTLAAALVSLGLAVSIATILHRPAVDGSLLNTYKYIVPWLSIPWFFGGAAALWLWPARHHSTQPLAPTGEA